MAGNIKIVRGLPFRVYETKSGTFMGYYNKKILHRATMPKLEVAMDEFAQRILGGDAARLTLSQLEIQQYQRALAILAPLNADLVEAARHYERTFSGHQPLTVSAAAVEFQAVKKRKGISREYENYLRIRLKWLADAHGDALVSAVTHQELAAWMRERGGSGRAYNNLRGLLVTFWRWCQREGYFPANQTVPPLKLERSAESREEVTVLSPRQLAWLLSTVSGGARDWVTLGAFFGIRAAEIERLEGKDIDLTHRTIEIAAHKAKTGQRRLMPIPDALAGFLRGLAKRERVTGYLPQRDVLDAIRGAEKPLLAAWPKNVLRHSWISYKLAETGNIDQVAAWAGTSRDKIYQNYRALRTLDGLPVTPRLAGEWFALAGKNQKNSEKITGK